MEHSHRASVCHPVSYTHLIIPPFSRDFGTKCPKAPALGCGKHFCENKGGRENIPPTPKAPRKSPVNAGVFRGYFSTHYLRLRRIYARFCSRRAAPAQAGEQYRCRPSGRKALPHTGQGRVSAIRSTVSDLSSTGSRGSTAEQK